MKTLIIPDVHGRTFWKKIVDSNLPIVFLGDYVDPYSFDGISKEDAINNFKEILTFAKERKNQVTLLLGNHDAHYVGYSPDCCRMDIKNAYLLYNLYKINENLFKVMHVIDNTIFTHAGITTEWLKQNDIKVKNNVSKIEKIVNNFTFTNEHLSEIDMYGLGCEYSPITQIGSLRGGEYAYGSPIWADARESLSIPAFEDYNQIFGHSQLQETGTTLHQKNCWMCDSRDVFVWDGEKLENYVGNQREM